MDDKSQNTEQLILAAATEEFLEKGFSGARTSSIAAAAGVTHSMLHYYFRTKEALFGRVVEAKFGELARMMAETLAGGDMPIKERIYLLLERQFAFLVENPRLPVLLMSEYNSCPERMREFIANASQLIKTIGATCVKQIDEAVAAGEMRPVQLTSLLVDVVSLNIISVAMAPQFSLITGKAREEFLAERHAENLEIIRLRIEV